MRRVRGTVGRVGRLLVIVAALTALGITPARAADPAPYGVNDAGGFRNVLPAGEAGVDNISQLIAAQANGAIPPHFADQLPLYTDLVYADPTLTDAQVPNFFKDATFGVATSDQVSSEKPDPAAHPGLTIVRDKYDVPHIYGQ